MALVLADRVKETTTTTGTGTITLAGASIGYRSFSAVGNGNTTYYSIVGQGNSEWEVGIGTYTSSGTTLSRDTVLSSSAGGTTKTNFSAGTKDVFVTYTATRSVTVDGSTVDTFGLGAAQGDILYASATDNFARLAKSSTATRYLANTGTSNNPQWDQVNLSNGVTGTLPLGNGGTGQTTAQASMNAFAGSVTSGQYLRGNGTNVVMSAIQVADVPTLNQNTTGTASNVTGTVAVANGGTGRTTNTAYAVICGGTTTGGAEQSIASVGTAGQVLTSNGAGALPTFQAVGAGTGPAFSAYQSSAQTLSSATLTKIQFQTEEFDTNSCFDSTTNYRFTPNVAGYYLVSGHIQPDAFYTAGIHAIYKNGSLYKYGSYNANATGVAQPSVTCLVYLNGSTDYVEFYASFTTGQAAAATSAFTWFQGHMARAA